MKTQNKKKIIVSTLALAMGAALAGSISGSVAWYQYSTRAAAQIQGTAVGTVGKLQVRGNKSGDAAGSWTNKAVLGTEQYKPMSIYKDGNDVVHYVNAPVYQTALLPEFGSGEDPYYVEYELEFKFEENDAMVADKKVYLSYFDIEKKSNATADVSAAVRVQISGEHTFLLSDVVEDDTSTTEVNELRTATKGNLDLNGNETLDTMEWDTLDAGSEKIVYKNAASGGEYYDVNAHADALIDKDAADADPYHIDSGNTAKVLTTTKASGPSEKVTVRIWLEGWALLGTSASWAKEYINQNFNVNMQFICEATAQ